MKSYVKILIKVQLLCTKAVFSASETEQFPIIKMVYEEKTGKVSDQKCLTVAVLCSQFKMIFLLSDNHNFYFVLFGKINQVFCLLQEVFLGL